MDRLMLSHKFGFTDEKETMTAKAGILHLYMPAYSVTILHHKGE